MQKLTIKKNTVTFVIGKTGSFKTRYFKTYAKNYNFSYIGTILKELAIPSSLNKYFNVEKTLRKNLKSTEELAFLTIISSLQNNKNLIIDNLFSFLTLKEKTKLINYLNKNKYTAIIITKNIEDILFGDNVVLFNNNEIVLNNKKEIIYKEEKSLKRLGLNLPFIINLSIQLNIYDLINKIYDNEEKMIGDIWK